MVAASASGYTYYHYYRIVTSDVFFHRHSNGKKATQTYVAITCSEYSCALQDTSGTEHEPLLIYVLRTLHVQILHIICTTKCISALHKSVPQPKSPIRVSTSEMNGEFQRHWSAILYIHAIAHCANSRRSRSTSETRNPFNYIHLNCSVTCFTCFTLRSISHCCLHTNNNEEQSLFMPKHHDTMSFSQWSWDRHEHSLVSREGAMSKRGEGLCGLLLELVLLRAVSASSS